MTPRYRVTCPCCQGERYLYAFEPDHDDAVERFPRPPEKHQCGHCQGRSFVPAEVEE